MSILDFFFGNSTKASEPERTPVNLIATFYMPGRAEQPDCPRTPITAGNFPYKIPDGKQLYVTHMLLVNKYPYDPPAYDAHMRAVYFQIPLITITSHHPDVHFDPPLPYTYNDTVIALITNGQYEGQNMYILVQGYLEDKKTMAAAIQMAAHDPLTNVAAEYVPG